MAWPKRHLNYESQKQKRLAKIGLRFNLITILSEGENVDGHYTFNCLCDCGNEILNKRYSDIQYKKNLCQICNPIEKNDYYSHENVKKRILENITVNSNGCWEWKKRIGQTGYGQIKYRGYTQSAHRVAYKVFKEEVSKELCVCHTCDNKICCNPDHLWVGSHQENISDRVAKNRNNHYKNKMKIEEVLEIRKLHPEYSVKQLSEKFNRSLPCIRNIVTFRSWL